jgi:prepilin-type N-terminal cleavage/methylation domain-containing protein/prepilin-type processing-associated H-X9-DG protein
MDYRERKGSLRPLSAHADRLPTPIINQPSTIINSDEGFTLIELLVVISIVALLMAILLPTLGRVRKQAQATACQANLRQWSLYYAAYTGDNDYRMPKVCGGGLTWNVPAVLAWQLRDLSAPGPDPEIPHLYGYQNLLLCPAARIMTESAPDTHVYGRTHSPWQERTHVTYANMASSYGQNAWMAGDPPNRAQWLTCLIKGASRIPVYLDSRYAFGLPEETEPPPEYEEFLPTDIIGNSMHFFAMDRHSGGINSLFLDWSVRKVGVKELWTLKWSKEFNIAGRWTRAGGVQPDDWPVWMRKFRDY